MFVFFGFFFCKVDGVRVITLNVEPGAGVGLCSEIKTSFFFNLSVSDLFFRLAQTPFH